MTPLVGSSGTLVRVRKKASVHALIYGRRTFTLPWQRVMIFRKV